jgi:hypothetical protein
MATAKEELEEVTGKAQAPMTDYVFPDRPRDYKPKPRSSAAIDLSRLGKQAGLLGVGFAPGAGVADYFGQFPSAQGGTEPSAVENFQQGNYGTAALQGLGAMGDLALTVPVAGMAVGSVMKAPRAAQKMLQELPKPDELGFYSQVQKAVMDNPQQKGTGAQFLAQIQKTPGVKAEELQYTGLDQFLAGKPSVTKGEIQDYLDANKVQVREVVLGQQPTEFRGNALYVNNELAGEIRDTSAGYAFRTSDGEYQLLGANRMDEAVNKVKQNLGVEIPETLPAKFTQFTLPGGTNYRELYLSLPTKQLSEAEARVVLDARPDARLTEADISFASNKATDQYRVPQAHSVSPKADVNRLAQLRVNDRVIDGKNTLFIEEIQSDWHQAGRKQGYQTGQERKATKANKMEGYWEVRDQNDQFITNVIDTRQDEAGALATANSRLAENDPMRMASDNRVPDAPFKTSWDELTLKRAIKLASDEGYDQIAFTTGRTQAERYELSREVESINVNRIGGGRREVAGNVKNNTSFSLQVDKNGRVEGANVTAGEFVGKQLSDIVGKDMASQIMEAKTGQSFTGLQLDIGGEGMKGFYDKMLPKKLEKIGKKYGAKATKTKMSQGQYNPLTKKHYQDGMTAEPDTEVWVMELPDDLKETVSTQGQPLFQLGAGAAGTAGIMSLTGEDAEAAQ